MAVCHLSVPVGAETKHTLEVGMQGEQHMYSLDIAGINVLGQDWANWFQVVQRRKLGGALKLCSVSCSFAAKLCSKAENIVEPHAPHVLWFQEDAHQIPCAPPGPGHSTRCRKQYKILQNPVIKNNAEPS